MPLSTGTRLGTYEILAAIRAGRMGEVYRARDTKLNRDVALKILPDVFADLMILPLENDPAKGWVAGKPTVFHPDGKRLAIIAAKDQTSDVLNQVVVVSNFFDYLWQIAPGRASR